MTPFTADKMFLHADRIADWQAGKLPPPVTVELDLTNLCNHACPGCTFSHLVNVDKSSIPFDLAIRIVKELGEIGVKGLTFSGGGEPLVYGEARVIRLMAEARAAGMATALITNGSLLRSERLLELCKWIRVSLDGYDAETFAKFHGRTEGEFEKVCQNLKTMAAMDKHGCTLGAGFLTDAGSLARGDFDKMASFCAGFPGLDYLQFRPLVLSMVADPTMQGGGLPSTEDVAAIMVAYQEVRKRHQRPGYRVLMSSDKYLALAEPNAGRTYDRCHAHFLQAIICADCKVYLCCHGQGLERFCLGDLRENGFAEIWRSDRAREVYERTNPQHDCPPACRLHSQNRALQQLQRSEHGSFI